MLDATIDFLFRQGHVADVVLACLAVELVALISFRRWTSRGPPPSALWPSLAAGACLALALRAALRGDHWTWIALPLTGALLSHVADLRTRMRTGPVSTNIKPNAASTRSGAARPPPVSSAGSIV